MQCKENRYLVSIYMVRSVSAFPLTNSQLKKYNAKEVSLYTHSRTKGLTIVQRQPV